MSNYLKHYRVVRYWACKHYELKQAELEMLFYLDDLEYFTRRDIKVINLVGFTKSPTQLKGWLERGWLKTIYKGTPQGGKTKYALSVKARQMIRRIYRILEGEEDLPESTRRNKFMTSSKHVEKKYAYVIEQIAKSKYHET